MLLLKHLQNSDFWNSQKDQRSQSSFLGDASGFLQSTSGFGRNSSVLERRDYPLTSSWIQDDSTSVFDKNPSSSASAFLTNSSCLERDVSGSFLDTHGHERAFFANQNTHSLSQRKMSSKNSRASSSFDSNASYTFRDTCKSFKNRSRSDSDSVRNFCSCMLESSRCHRSFSRTSGVSGDISRYIRAACGLNCSTTSGGFHLSISGSRDGSDSSARASCSPRNSTTSSDSGRGSTSAMDINELRCDLEYSESVTPDLAEEDIYETIPDHLINDHSNEDDTLCEDVSVDNRPSSVFTDSSPKKRRFHSAADNQRVVMDLHHNVSGVTGAGTADDGQTGSLDNTYATIDGETAEGYMPCSSLHEYSTLTTTPTPPPPPVRGNHGHRDLAPARVSQQRLGTRGSVGRRRVQGIRRTDIISSNPFHVYTVGEVLESFHRLASNIPLSPPQPPASPSHSSQISQAKVSANQNTRTHAHVRQPIRTPLKPRDLNTQGQNTRELELTAKRHINAEFKESNTTLDHRIRTKASKYQKGHRGQQGRTPKREQDLCNRHRGSSAQKGRETMDNRENVPPRGVSGINSRNSHQRASLRSRRSTSGVMAAPVWKPSVHHLQGTLC